MKQELSLNISRVQQAHEEVGKTDIRPLAAVWFVMVWLFLLGTVPVVDHLVEWSGARKGDSVVSLRSLAVVRELPAIGSEVAGGGMKPSAWLAANRRLLKIIEQTEDDIEEQAAVASWLRPWTQRGLLMAGVGNEKVYPGKESWLFYRQDIDSVTGPGFLEELQLERRTGDAAEWEEAPRPDPLPAIIDFHHQLSTRGISLLVVPVPVKPELEAKKFTNRLQGRSLVQNSSYSQFLAQLEDAGVWVADVSAWLAEYKHGQPKVPFLLTDTHWTPAAMQWVAKRLAAELAGHLSGSKTTAASTRTEVEVVTNKGDIAAMLDLPVALNPYPDETVRIERITYPEGAPWRAGGDAELLVLGDSFSNIYSLGAMGWGESAGFVEHLSHYLSRPVDRIIRNDQGAHATRQLLSREQARGRDRLAGKKVVLFQFASRELALGDWPLLSLQLKEPEPSAFLSVEPGERMRVRGLIREVSAVPRPGSVPYRDHVVSIHLVDIRSNDNPDSYSQAVVFMQSMKDNVWTRAARLRPGDEVELTVMNWSDVAGEKDGLNRSELDQLELQLQEPVWAEWQEK